MTNFESEQRALYDRIATAYETHYDGPWSQSYRQRFMYQPMFEGVSLEGARVLEAMSGSGQATGYLLSRGATVVGLDISAGQLDIFKKKWPSCETVCASILDSGLAAESFDYAVVVGGLHHVQPQVDDAILEIARVLRPGGHFCFVEPHAGSLPDRVRKLWYRRDPLFEDNEAALDLATLHSTHAGRFDVEVELFSGNLGYLLVLQSLVLRVPLWLKDLYASPLLRLEGLLASLQGPRSSCFVVGRWRKRASGPQR